MKQCTRCGNMLAQDATYCDACNTPQTTSFDEFEPKPKNNDTFLKVLCILTIVGAAFGLISLPFNMSASTEIGYEIPGIILAMNFISIGGKLAGAILMLKKKLSGLYIYTVAAIVSIISSIYSATTITGVVGSTFAVIGATVGLVFIIAFLVMYWLPVNKKLLS